MKLIPLPIETIWATGMTHKLIVGYQDLNGTSNTLAGQTVQFSSAWTSGTAQAVIPPNALGATSITFPAGTQVELNAVANVTTAFTSSGGAITSLGLSFGDGTTAARFLSAVDLKTAGYATGVVTTGRFLYTAADTLDLTATISGQTMASLNAGEVEILCCIRPVNDLAVVR